MTTAYLANMAIPIISRFFVSSSTMSFMARLSGRLETLNIASAKAIETGRLSGSNLDARMVHMEQSAVQRTLDDYKKEDSKAYSTMIKEVNGLMNSTSSSRTAAGLYPSDSSYQGVLDGVRSRLGRKIDFENQMDREAIGNALIQQLNDRCRSKTIGINTCV